MKIPLVLISYNNHTVFKKSIESLIKNTSEIYELIVVDNNSNDPIHQKYLLKLSEANIIKLYKNRLNQFTFGLNRCLKDYDTIDNEYFVICDSDFLYPKPFKDKCWLTVLLHEMELSPFIGKLGISISLDNIKNVQALEGVYLREKSFSRVSLNNNVWAAQVDTTPAIYRKNLFFWNKFRLYPGHMTANKPYYHIGRHKNIIGYHMGWDSDEYRSKDFTVSKSKIDSFALYGGALQSEVVNGLNIFLKLRFFCLKFISKLFWISFKSLTFAFFLLKGRLFFINELLYKK